MVLELEVDRTLGGRKGYRYDVLFKRNLIDFGDILQFISIPNVYQEKRKKKKLYLTDELIQESLSNLVPPCMPIWRSELAESGEGLHT